MTTGAYPMHLDPDSIDAGKAVAEAAKSSGFPAVLMTTLVALITGFVALREWFSRNAVTSAANSAQTELINLLREQIKTESERADKAEKDKADALAMVSGLKAEIQNLTLKVEALQAQIAKQA